MDRPVHIIDVPADYGANRRGVHEGPSAIRQAGLVDWLRANDDVDSTDAENVETPSQEVDKTEDPANGTERPLNLKEVRGVCEALTGRVTDVLSADTGEDRGFPLVLGGDHSVTIGSLSGSAEDADVGVLWFDAHADFNTSDTSPTDNMHGMPLAAALGRGSFAGLNWAEASGVDPKNVAIVGLRDVDDEELDQLEDSDIEDHQIFWMRAIERDGITAVVEEALDIVADGVDGVHVSHDIDWLDPTIAPGVGAPVHGGVTYREARTALEKVAEWNRETGLLRSMDVVELNPAFDDDHVTAEMAVDLTVRALTEPPVSQPDDHSDRVKWPAGGA